MQRGYCPKQCIPHSTGLSPGCCREVVQEAWEAIKAMREEFQEQNNVYWAAEQEFRAWRNVDRERKYGPPHPVLRGHL